MNSDEKLHRIQMTQIAQEILLEWLTESHLLVLALCAPDIKIRSLTAMSGALQKARQNYVDLLDPLLPPDRAGLQASWLRGAFDEAALKIEMRLGLPH